MGAADRTAPRRGRAQAQPNERAERERRERRAARSASSSGTISERLIAGVPARIMRPRLVFIACLAAIVVFGLLMVYSASSVEAMKEEGDAAYFLTRQALFALAGLVAIAIIAASNLVWGLFARDAIWGVWGIMVALLLVVLVMGLGSRGAVRWIGLGFFTLQPSEFMKPVLILLVAKLASDYYEEESIDTSEFLFKLALGALVPLGLIFIQPDMGSTMIIGVTLFLMLFLSGISMRVVLGILGAIGLFFVVMLVIAPYRMERLLVSLDPWSDPYGSGYQATLAIMAFASGGLFGRGIGNSTMKYNYLPEAHNDYILAIIGEELGFVGTLVFFAVYAGMICAGFAIARQARTMRDRLIADGCSMILMIQFLVNALGILGAIPMTGKTMPFISYGGSSLLASMILAGLVIRVSIESNRSTVYDARRAGFAVMSEENAASGHMGRTTAGEPMPRRASGASARRTGFSVYDGAADASPGGGSGGPRPAGRAQTARSAPLAGASRDATGGYGRVDLHGDSADRLRGRGPTVRTRPRGAAGRGAGWGRPTSRGDRRGDRYDR